MCASAHRVALGHPREHATCPRLAAARRLRIRFGGGLRTTACQREAGGRGGCLELAPGPRACVSVHIQPTARGERRRRHARRVERRPQISAGEGWQCGGLVAFRASAGVVWLVCGSRHGHGLGWLRPAGDARRTRLGRRQRALRCDLGYRCARRRLGSPRGRLDDRECGSRTSLYGSIDDNGSTTITGYSTSELGWAYVQACRTPNLNVMRCSRAARVGSSQGCVR